LAFDRLNCVIVGDPGTLGMQVLIMARCASQVSLNRVFVGDPATPGMQVLITARRASQVSLNRVFVGNPGTVKTTVAKLYRQISKGEIVLSRDCALARLCSRDTHGLDCF
jgi:hypothetical protein